MKTRSRSELQKEVEEGFDEVVEINCIVKIRDGAAKVFAVAYDSDTNKWKETDITSFVPLDEAMRVHSLALDKKRLYFHKLGKDRGLW